MTTSLAFASNDLIEKNESSPKTHPMCSPAVGNMAIASNEKFNYLFSLEGSEIEHLLDQECMSVISSTNCTEHDIKQFTPDKTIVPKSHFSPRKTAILAQSGINLDHAHFLNKSLRCEWDELNSPEMKAERIKIGLTFETLKAFKTIYPRIVVNPAFENDAILLSPVTDFLPLKRRLFKELEESPTFSVEKESLYYNPEPSKEEIKRHKTVHDTLAAQSVLSQTLKTPAYPHFSYEIEVFYWKPFIEHFQDRAKNINGLKITREEYKLIFHNCIAPQYSSFNAGNSTVYYSLKIIDLGYIYEGRSNLQRIKSAKSPLGSDKEPMNIHHVSFTNPGTLAFISERLHQEFAKVLHLHKNGSIFHGKPSAISRKEFEYHKRHDIYPSFVKELKAAGYN